MLAMLKAVGANVEHLGPVGGVGLCMRTLSSVEAETRFVGFLFRLLPLLLPCLGCGCVWEAKELGLDDFLLGQ